MRDELVERVARAMASADNLDWDEACDDGNDWEGYEALQAKRWYMHLARAAIAAMPDLAAENARLRKAVAEAKISLGAIGEPPPNDPPDAHICGVIARSCLVRISAALGEQQP